MAKSKRACIAGALMSCAILVATEEARACRGPAPKDITKAEALERAAVVFVGKVTRVTPGLPADYAPADAAAFARRKAEVERQGLVEMGRTIVFSVEDEWKGVSGKSVVLVEMTATNTCERGTDIDVGDRVIVFATMNGNYPALHPGVFNTLRPHTVRAPRANSGAQPSVQGGEESAFKQALAEMARLRRK